MAWRNYPHGSCPEEVMQKKEEREQKYTFVYAKEDFLRGMVEVLWSSLLCRRRREGIRRNRKRRE